VWDRDNYNHDYNCYVVLSGAGSFITYVHVHAVGD